MAKLKHLLLGTIGLATKDQLTREMAKKQRWHGLVRDVFSRYYLKLREPFYEQLPALPHRYSDEWEDQIKKDLDDFLQIDLQSVAELLEVCGFGTQKWEQVKDAGFSRFEELIDQHLASYGDGGNLVDESPPELEAALAEARNEIRKLRIGGRRALEQIKGYEIQIEQLEQEPGDNGSAFRAEEEAAPPPETLFAPDEELSRQAEELQRELGDRENTIETLGNRIEQLEQELADNGSASRAEEEAAPSPETLFASDEELSRQAEELQQEISDRENTVESLRKQIEQLESDLDQAPASAEDSLLVDDDLAQQNAQLRREIRAKDNTIETLRGQVEEIESAMGSARDQLLDQVKKLGELAAGDIELKPSEELDNMSAEELLSYAEDVASDLDVRKQTLDQGLQGIEELRSNYEEGRRVYDVQQRKLEAQLEEMNSELERYQQQQENSKEGDANAPKIIAAQRQQLDLLSSRITELSNTNKNLNISNQKMYKDMETAVRKLIPLRHQIDELQTLRETLTSYIRQKYDPMFTTKKLDQ